MKTHLLGIALISITLSLVFGCEKEDPNDFSIEIKLIDEFGVQKSKFELGDSLIFEFYLTNHTGIVAEYLRPCGEFGDFLKIYQEVLHESYEYFGKPEYYCATIVVHLSISDEETIRLNRVPWSTGSGWPEMESERYYVGDTLTLYINERQYDITERIYFELCE